MWRIAADRELWFEKPGFPPVPLHRFNLPRPWRNAVPSGNEPVIMHVMSGETGPE